MSTTDDTTDQTSPAVSELVVKLTLVDDVARHVNADPEASRLRTEWLPKFSTVPGLEDDVLRFLQTKDKYTALLSSLLKSQAYWTVRESKSVSHPVVRLPRTEHKKPYIPTLRNGHESPISISHQFPFCGLAQLLPTEDASLQMGMDIVVFEDYNPKLYSSQEEFLNVFRESSFTTREWEWIQQSSPSGILQEFYVRWAMKEAYTKALGVGLGFEFNSFELALARDDEEEGFGIWDSIWSSTTATDAMTLLQNRLDGEAQGSYHCATARARKNDEASSPPELWDFYFLPLYSEDANMEEGDAATLSYSRKPNGCCCICVGPLPPTPLVPTGRFQVQLQHTTLANLVEWHTGDSAAAEDNKS